jgi:hypothetical protein
LASGEAVPVIGDPHSAEMRVFAKDARFHISTSRALPGQFDRRTADNASISSPMYTTEVKVVRHLVVQVWSEADESDSIWSSPPSCAASVAATSRESDTLARRSDPHFSMMSVASTEPLDVKPACEPAGQRGE